MGGKKEGPSLKARGKKPLASLNTIFMRELRKAPQAFLRARLEKLITERAPSAPKAFVSAFAEHLVEGRDEEFVWNDGSDDDTVIDLELGEDDFETVLHEARTQMEEELPKIIPEVVKGSAAGIVRTLKADWPTQRAFEEARMEEFRGNLRARWGDAFDTLRMMYTIATEIGGEVVQRWRRSRGRKDMVLRDTLTRLHARACQVTMEIITLMESGFADGAIARWRTLHELAIVATLLVEHGEQLAIRYRAHEAIEAKRAMDRYVLYHAQLGYAPMSKARIDATEKAYENCLAKYGDRFGSEYGWAAHHLGIKKPRLVDLEAAVGKEAMQSYYRMASYNVHAGSRGLTFRLGILDGAGAPIAIAGASNAGFVDPVQNTAFDLVLITTLLSSGTARFDRMLEWQILIDLRNELPKKLRKAQRELDRAYRAQLKAEQQAAHAGAKAPPGTRHNKA